MNARTKLNAARAATAIATTALATGCGGSATDPTGNVSEDLATIQSNWAPSSGAYVFERANMGTSATDYQDSTSRETKLGGKFDGFMTYLPCNVSAANLADARNALLSDHTPFVVLSWCTGNNPTTIIPDIAAGKYDADITGFATAVASQLSGVSGAHVLIRPFWEFNYAGSEWSARNYGNNYSLFGAAWRRFPTIFAAHGVANVKWLFNPIRIGSTQSDSPVSYYNAVGSQYVDWIGLDAYPKNKWLSLETLMTTSSGVTFNWYSWAAATGKPLMIGETSILPCSDYSSCSETRANWWQDIVAKAPAYPSLKAVETFDSQASSSLPDWRVDAPGPTADSATSAYSAYAAWAKSVYFNPLGRR